MVASAVWQHEVAYHPLWKNCGVYPPKRRWWIVPALAIITLAVLGSALQGRRSSSRRYPRQLFCVGLVGFPVRARGTAARMNPLQLESGRLGDWIGASPRDGRARKYRERPESRLRHAALRPYSAPRQGFDLAPTRVHIRRCPAGRVWPIFRHTPTAYGRGRGLEPWTGLWSISLRPPRRPLWDRAQTNLRPAHVQAGRSDNRLDVVGVDGQSAIEKTTRL